MSKKIKKAEINYLDLVPVKNDNLPWESNDEELVTIYKENTGVVNRLAQKIAKQPRVSQIHLDELGSFIWRSIDGEISIYDIAELVKEKFGDKAEPLYNRLVQYMHTLEAYDFISTKTAGE